MGSPGLAMVGPEGVGKPPIFNALDCQTDAKLSIEFEGEFSRLSNRNAQLPADILELLGVRRSCEKETPLPTAMGNGARAFELDLSSLDTKKDDPTQGSLDLPLAVSRFPDVRAGQVESSLLSLRDLAQLIGRTRGAAKSDLPLLKLATFGTDRTPKGSLRHDGNLQALSGIEGDYDAGQIAPEVAAERLRAAGLAALVYTTPSHTPAAPRWRVLCPLSVTADPADREGHCARVNGALGGILSPESFTRSQTYYFGAVDGQAPPEVHLIEGRAIDKATELPDLGRSQIELPADDLEPFFASDIWDPAPDWARIKSALRSIKDASDRTTWLEIGQALHHGGKADPAEAYRLWGVWSKRCPEKYDEASQRRTWASFSSDRKGAVLGIGTLFHHAKLAGWSGESTPAPSRLSFLTPTDCETAPSRGYVIKGFVAPGDVGCIFGAPGAGKSLLAPFLGYMVASGSDAFGMRTKAGPVFYVAAEDPHGMRGRVKALKLAHGDAPGFTLVEGVSDLLRADSADLVALEAAVKERAPALIIIDTLAMAFPGLEENSAEAMGRVVAVARRLAEGGAAVVLIHHDTKAEGATPRGHSLLNGALDVALHVKRDPESGIIRGTLTKNRNGACDLDIAFRIATEDGGTDQDGDKISLPRCNPITAPRGQREKRLSPSALAALAVLSKLGTPSEDEWRQACVDGRTVSASEDVESRKRVFRRAVADLVRSERVLFQSGRYSENDGFDAMIDLIAAGQPDSPGQYQDKSGQDQPGKASETRTTRTAPLKGLSVCPEDAPPAWDELDLQI
jgi:hypothetical protein